MWLLNIIGCMYVILVYDIGERRVARMLKLCRQYLNWIQNSVFEGEITEVKLKELLHRAKAVMDVEHDSIIVFKSRQEKWLEKQVLGQDWYARVFKSSLTSQRILLNACQTYLLVGCRFPGKIRLSYIDDFGYKKTYIFVR
jgi:CRISPR-associated protein Cas2